MEIDTFIDLLFALESNFSCVHSQCPIILHNLHKLLILFCLKIPFAYREISSSMKLLIILILQIVDNFLHFALLPHLFFLISVFDFIPNL